MVPGEHLLHRRRDRARGWEQRQQVRRLHLSDSPVRGFAALLALAARAFGDERVKILRPVDGAALQSGELSIVARATNGRFELDGKEVPAELPFAGVFHARANPLPGAHTLALVWDTGRRAVRF